jgi:pantoate--beta-alanine ligase
MSSRNAYLNEAQRRQATCLWQAIQTARRECRRARAGLNAGALTARLKEEIERNPEASVDYLAFFDPVTLQPVAKVRPGTHFALAVRVGKTRLIDNARL